MTALLRLAWHRLSIYLPVMLMGLLALSTYWLVRNSPAARVAETMRAPTHEADYFMKTFSVKTFDANSRLQNEVIGNEARHFPDNDTLEIDKARIRSMDLAGRLTVATADRALSNSDGSEVQLFGNAVVTRSPLLDAHSMVGPQLEFRSEFLHAFMNTERVASNQPVVITRGSDRFTGDSMDFTNLDQVLQMRGRVKGVINPGRVP